MTTLADRIYEEFCKSYFYKEFSENFEHIATSHNGRLSMFNPITEEFYHVYCDKLNIYITGEKHGFYQRLSTLNGYLL